MIGEQAVEVVQTVGEEGLYRRRHLAVQLAPPPLDPEQIKRDQEFARLRVGIGRSAPVGGAVLAARAAAGGRSATPAHSGGDTPGRGRRENAIK